MATLRLSLAIAVILAVGMPGRLALGQIVSGIENGPHPGPFIEPDTFRPDFQFFAPADVTNYETGRDVDPNVGFFFTYDRVYMNVTRPESEFPVAPPSGDPAITPTTNPLLTPPYAYNRFSFVKESPSYWEGDFTWGNRLEFGFMDCDDKGWDFVAWHIDGPNEEDRITNGDRLMGPFSTVEGEPDPASEPTYGFQNINLTPLNTALAIEARNDLPIRQSVNVGNLSGFEINRLMERHYFHNGGVIEPLVGVRYIKFEDKFRYAFYERIQSDPFPSGIDDVEIYRDIQSHYENNMLGPQLGFRLFKETGHWKLSSELRMFALQNWQHYSNKQDNYIWSSEFPAIVSPDPDVGRAPTYARQERFVNYANESEFVWGGELKLEAAYQLTKYISLRAGFTMLDLGQGVGRGLTLRTNDQDVQMFGTTFGFDINR
jgi:hypothetical protein